MSGTGKALFLDRDGVVNVDHGYVHTIESFEFVEGIFDLCSLASRRGFRLIIVTNQAGIGRGYYTEEQFHMLMGWVTRQFAAEGIRLDGYYFCPDHPDGIGPYRRRSFMRKPAPGMLLRAADEHDLALSRSLLIGDQASDIAAGRAAGLAATIHLAGDGGTAATGADVTVRDLEQACQWLSGWDGSGATGSSSQS